MQTGTSQILLRKAIYQMLSMLAADALLTHTFNMHSLGHHKVCVMQATTESLKMHRETIFMCASVVATRSSAQQKTVLSWGAWIVMMALMKGSCLVSAASNHTAIAIQEGTVWCVLSPTVLIA